MEGPYSNNGALVEDAGKKATAKTYICRRPPLGLRWRSSYWFTTYTVGLGIAVDLLVYTIILPVIPFQLQKLGYTGVSAHTGWLLFAFSAGLVFSTIPIAVFSERYSTRRMPLVIGLLILIGSQVMLMEAPIYAVMCIARLLQGIGSSMVWIVGLALLCDVTPENLVGRQLGLAMTGMSAGMLIGPPVGGALYSRFGFRGPFIFSIGATVVDLVARLLIIERKEALLWGIDSKARPVNRSEEASQIAEFPAMDNAVQEKRFKEVGPSGYLSSESTIAVMMPSHEQQKQKRLSLLNVILRLGKSSRALVAFTVTFVYGLVYISQEPSLPLHVQDVWGLNSAKVGLIFLAAVVPTLISSPLTGWCADKFGSEWITFICLSLALPWWVLVVIDRSLAFFTVVFALETFFTSGVVSPLMAELASISRDIEGVGYAHVYGAFNVAYGLGSAAGPLIGGQIYDNVEHGWTVLCLLATGLIFTSIVLSFFFIGVDPLGRRLRRALRLRRETSRPVPSPVMIMILENLR